MMKEITYRSTLSFSLNVSSLSEVAHEANTLNINKSNPQNSVSAQHLKEYIDICGEVLLELINKSIINSDFEEVIKLADITPVHKKDDAANKFNYRPISGLPSCSRFSKKSSNDKLPHTLKPI